MSADSAETHRPEGSGRDARPRPQQLQEIRKGRLLPVQTAHGRLLRPLPEC